MKSGGAAATSHNQDSMEKFSNRDIIVYVLGGPGSGKGTQCSKIVEHFGFTHLSAGELLETEVKSGSETGKMIQEFKKEGKLVPSEVVVKLLQQAMQKSRNRNFLIDGFPRNEENRVAAEKMLNIQPTIVLVFDCSEEETIRRVLHRNQGRVDDNMDTIKKRLKVYKESTLPVIDYFTRKGKVRKINAEKPIEEVFRSVEAVFSELGLAKHTVGRACVQTA
ncbi:UMP-CMP kinase 3 isoform X2 [Beta vulgaris subsp. vulgaris]|uniref:UMP-CMP kinase 3 isoform X2 n=1 Tax=Beta vulgaris subsp. vulgaris TaxID=3555 RepID=UPI0005401C8D|nr:UMP-CMP kinase 3 isoform X2 [Beta vulgaris subsp. vulgaris]